MPFPLIDYHCHLDLYPDYQQAFNECNEQKILALTVTTTPRAWEKNKEFAGDNSTVRVGLGLHPQVVAQYYQDISLFEKLLPQSKFVGEVGLDASPQFYSSFSLQKELFERILRLCAEQESKVLSIHAVRSVREVLTLIEKHLPPGKGKAVLHWFSGTASEAERAAKLGCYFSINQEMLLRERSREIVHRLPLTRILTETDGPFTSINGRPSKPSDVRGTVSLLAKTFGLTDTKLTEIMAENLRKLEC